ncbi:MAG TPA: PAS domain S-box protein, partial [Anaerolineaceae bacterium]
VATRRSAEIALQASESHLRQIISQLPAVLWTTDQSLELTSLMGTRLAESQAQLETLLRTDLKQLAQAGDFSRPVVMAHAGALHGRRTEFELECGGLILQCMVEPFRGLEGDIKGCLGVALDITARKRSDETISRQHAALEAAADGIMITDENGLIQWANPAMTAITGFPVAELLGRTPAVFQSGRHPREFYATLWGTIRSGRVWQGETYNRRKDGRLYVEDQTITPVKDASGKILNFIAIKHDITSRKKAEEEITRRNRELQALRDAGVQLTQSLEPDVVFQTMLGLVEGLVPDADRIMLYLQVEDGLQLIGVRGKASRSAAEYPALLDPAHHPLIQSALETLENRLIHDTTSEPLWAPLLDGLETRAFLGVPLQLKGNTLGICCLESETPGCFSAQETHLVEAFLGQAAVAVQNARLYQVVRDGRERLQQLSRRLVDVQEMERRYIARELHDDTSQALVGLVFALEVLKRDAGDPQAVAASVTELDHLISDILDNLHRLAVNLRPAALDHLGLIAAIRQYVDGLREKYHLAIHLAVPELPSRLPQEMETTLYRIIQEALANVVLHARASTAEVRLELLPGQLRALIADDGIGFNLDEALAEERLGLFGMRERAEMLGGSLAIDSAPGAGTRISLEVPCEFSNPDRG